MNATLDLAHGLDERRAFVLVSLALLGGWMVLYSGRAMLVRRRSRWVLLVVPMLLGLGLIAVAIGHGMAHKEIFMERSGVNTMFIVLIGLLFGSLAAKPILSLFDSRFSMRRPLLGVLALAALMTVWYLPLWRTEVISLLREAGISSVKASVVEVSFRDNSPTRSAVLSAGGGNDIDKNSAVARPSDPRPGLAALAAELIDEEKRDTSGATLTSESTLTRDWKYMAYLAGRPVPLAPIPAKPGDSPLYSPDDIISGTSLLLDPLRPLIACLQHYVGIFPDSHLLLVDVKPVIQTLFTMHARSLRALGRGSAQRPGSLESTQPRRTMQETLTLAKSVGTVHTNVLGTVDPDSPLGKNGTALPQASFEDEDARTFNSSCHEPSSVRAWPTSNLPYLQPYTAIALANLLVAHDSSDEALEVMTQWLDVWRCARREGRNTAECDFPPIPKARELPEWLGLRMEIELNLLLYRLAGEANLSYRDFLRDHQKHLADYLANAGRQLDVASEIKRCAKEGTKPDEAGTTPAQRAAELETRVNLFRTLISNDNTLLRAEVHHLQDAGLPELEALYARSKLIANATAECLDPTSEKRASWEATAADFQITKGVVGLAVSDRISTIAASSDERDRALVIRNEAKAAVWEGYKALKVFRDQDREESKRHPLSEQVFWMSGWEESYQLAGRMIQRLNSAER